MTMIRKSRNHYLQYLVLIILFDITNSHDNGTSIRSQRHGRVSGRIVKLYSGPKPDPILCTSEGFLADTADCSVFYRCLKATNGKYTVYRFQCGPGTVYDPDTEICNHPRSTKRLECSGLSNDKVITSTERYIENEIDGLHKENHELPTPISTKPPKVSNPLLITIATSKPVSSESYYMTTSYPWLSNSEHVNEVITTTSSTISPWNLQAALSSNKPWENTQTTNYVTRRPSKQSGVQCTSDGFMGDDLDCRKFYRCVNNQRGGYLRYEFSCSETTIWDDDTQGCNHPWAVQRRRCGKGNNYDENSIGVNEINPNNIIQQQTQISYGSKVTETSTGSAMQNQNKTNFGDRQNVNIREDQTQIDYGVPTSQSQPQFSYGNKVTAAPVYQELYSHPSQPATQILDSMASTSIPNNKRIGSNICTKAGFMGDSNDCKKFYRCIGDDKRGFTVYQFSCTEGTSWDEELEACNHSWAVKECGGKKSNKNISPTVTIIENTTVKYITTSSIDNNEINKNYYGNQNNQEEEGSASSTVTQATGTSSASFSTGTVDSSKPYEILDCKSSGFFGNLKDCTKFYRCVENGGGKFTKYEYKCGDGTVWDPEIESCNHAWLVKSCGSKATQSENNKVSSNLDNAIITTVSLIQTTTQKNIPDVDYNSGYQIIQNEPPLTATTTTERISNQGYECKTSGFMGDSDCKKFYRCVENGHGGFTRHEFTCGEGTVWDPKIEACNHAWAVKTCGISAGPDNPVTPPNTIPQDEDNGYINNNNNENIEKDPNSTIKTTTSSSTTYYTTPGASKANDCQSNGFMGDNNNCKIFYRCVENGNGGFIRYEFSCGDGTVWDPKIAACNHAWAVEKCEGSESVNPSPSTHDPNFTTAISSETSTQHTTMSSSTIILTSTISDSNNPCTGNGFIGDKHDCKKFYRCVEDGNGSFTRYEFECGEGTVWDSKIQACNHVWAVESCGSNPSESVSTSRSTTLKDEETNDNHVTQGNQENGSTENTPLSSSTTISSTSMTVSEQCKTDGFVGDSNDCKKFYRCVNDGKGGFIRYEFSCGDGTIWDSEINACNHENSDKSPCRSTTLPGDNTNDKEPNNSVSSSTSETNDYSTTSKEPPKSHQCIQEGFIGDESDCKKFYRCTDNGQGGFHKYEFTCGEGTIWDQEILACNHGSPNSNCRSVNTQPETDNSVVHSTTPAGTSQSTEKTQNPSNNDECNSEGFYANSNDCKKFFRCVGDGKGGFTRYDFTCGEGTIWVQDIQACDHDSDTSVCSQGSVATTTTTTTTIAPSHSSQEKPITSSDTSTTTSAIIDKSTTTSSMKPTMQDETVSESSSTHDDKCEEAGYFGNSNDCKMFYRCVDNGNGGFTKYDFTCGDGTIWDQEITACNHPQDVSNPSCQSGGNSESATTTAKSTTTAETSNETSEPTKSTSSTESTTTQSSDPSTQGTSTTKPNNCTYTCNEAGFYADPCNCKKFYRCVDWGGDGKSFSIYHFDCGEGTIWDPNVQTCNHEDSVYPPRDCSGTQSQTESANNTTTTEKQEETTQSSTTTGSSSTTDQTSTQESSTSGQTSSTQQSTTQSSTTEQSTTQKSTTEQSTTQKSTTEQSTTEQSTTEQSTTQKSTTEQSTTQQSTTQQSTTQKSTTTSEQSSTTQQSSTSEQLTTTNEQTSEETTTASPQTTTSESTTSTTDQTTKAEQSTTQESTEQSSESQSSTTEQSTTQDTTDGGSTTQGQDSTTEQETSNKECPEIDDDQYMFVCPTGFRRHPKYCNLFYQCTEDDDSHEMKLAVFNCPNNTIYDESKTQCVEEEKADKKCDGQISQRRRVKRLDALYKEPITVGKEKYLCPSAGHFPFEKNEQCSPVLFKCEISKSGKLRGFIYQCPEGYVYWSVSRRCEPAITMTECRGSLVNWSGRYEIPIERSNVANKAIK